MDLCVGTGFHNLHRLERYQHSLCLMYSGASGVAQLKNLHRFALMAATLSVIPILLCLQQLRWGKPWLALLVAAALCFPLPNAHHLSARSIYAIKGGPCIALPYQRQPDAKLLEPMLRTGADLINPPPFEIPNNQSEWVEVDPLANELISRSGNGHARLWLSTNQLEWAKQQSPLRCAIVNPVALTNRSSVENLLSSIGEKVASRDGIDYWLFDEVSSAR